MRIRSSTHISDEAQLASGCGIATVRTLASAPPTPLVVATHDGAFHADDAFGVAIVKRVFSLTAPGRPVMIVRTRDPELLSGADIVLDVGGVFDGRTRFDHHQPEGAGKRRDGVPFAASGLIWNKFGRLLLRLSLLPEAADEVVESAFRRVDQSLIRHLDAVDNGVTLGPPLGLSVSELISHMNPTWLEDRSSATMDAKFESAVSAATVILDNLCKVSATRVLAKDIVRRAAREAGQVLVLDFAGIPWQETVVTEFPDVLFVVYPATDSGWRVRTVPQALGTFAPRKALPAEWAGLGGDELTRVTGVPGCVFAHRGRFLAGNDTLEGAQALAALAVAA